MEKLNLKTRLGKRLTALFKAIPDDATNLYDLCCDHGAIGRAALETYPDCLVTFNDIHPDIMSRLGEQLRSFNASNYKLSVMPAEEVKVCEQGKPSILLAGVGDEQCITILKALMTQNLPETTHFIVSPATKTFFVRTFLAEMPINVLHDHVVSENKRCYEIIEFDLKTSTEPLNPFGTGWQENDPVHIAHLKKILAFYRAQQKSEYSSSTDFITDGYGAILKKISRKS